MNWFQFLRLLRAIYGKRKPDLAWIQSLGLLAVKIGQVHALRIDFLDREKCEHLARLFRHTSSVPPEELHRLLAAYMDDETRSRFSEIESEPLASASVGQVHRARLTDGDDVVIKVVKGDFREQFLGDLRSVRRFLKFVLFVYPKLRMVGDPLGILSDIEEYTLAELDLRNEMEGQKRLRRIFEENRDRFDLSKLRFPRVYENLSGRNIMVSETVPGETFDELLSAGRLDYQALLDLFHVHMFYVFGIGTFHGDIHPGNIILYDDHLYFVDTGYIGRVGERIRRWLYGFFEALVVYDYERCAEALNRMADRGISGRTYEQFRVRFLDLYSDFTDKTVSEVSLTTKMMETIKLGVNSGMVFEKGIFAIIRSLMYLDGMVLRCKPEAILMRDMRPYMTEGKRFFSED